MKIVLPATLVTLMALPAFAGDQPVIYPNVRFDTDVTVWTAVPVSGGTPELAPVSTGQAGAAQSSAGSATVGAALIGQSGSDQLYAKLLAEAKARGLR